MECLRASGGRGDGSTLHLDGERLLRIQQCGEPRVPVDPARAGTRTRAHGAVSYRVGLDWLARGSLHFFVLFVDNPERTTFIILDWCDATLQARGTPH